MPSVTSLNASTQELNRSTLNSGASHLLHLELRLCCLVVGSNGLHETQARALDSLNILVFLLVGFCVRLLQTLNKLLEISLELFLCRHFLINGRLQVCGGHS